MKTPPGSQKVIIDTDIGNDVDDAFAVALALRSPELQILAVSTTLGDTEMLAKILDRLLGDENRTDIPVAVGSPTTYPNVSLQLVESQRRFSESERFQNVSHPHAVDFILEQIRQYPGEITVVTIGPLSNVGALIDKDPELFRKLKGVVMMGGSIKPIMPEFGNGPSYQPAPEFNILCDVPSAQKLFKSGVSLVVMPLDSTLSLKLDEIKRNLIFSEGTPLTDNLTLLYHQWSANYGVTTPTLFDSLPIAYLLEPQICPVEPMRICVDDDGFTRVEAGEPNAQVCLRADREAFWRLHMSRLLG